jgi:nucleotide-binding universal stress UspA family protein
MTRFATVLVATDGTNDSDGAVDAALDLAHDTGARLLVLTVVPEGSAEESGEGDEGPSRESSSRDEDDEVTQASDRTNGVVDHAIEWGLDAQPLIWEGEPGEAIVAAATSEGADVIVIGTSSKSGVGRILLGSVTDHVVQHASMPVMVVRTDRERE